MCPRLHVPAYSFPFQAKKNFVVARSTGFSPFVHSFSTDRLRRASARQVRSAVLLSNSHRMTRRNTSIWLAAFLLVAGGRLAATEGVTFFRVFLTDGTAVVSYGEFARVGDRV